MQTIKLTLNESQLASVMIAVNKELANAQTVTDQEFSNESTRILIQNNIEKFYCLPELQVPFLEEYHKKVFSILQEQILIIY